MFSKSAAFYDAIYSWKDYARESTTLHNLISIYKESEGNSLLDIACGTGGHIAYLKEKYAIEGLDIDTNMLEIARLKFPTIIFHEENMIQFDLLKKFDIIMCLFSSIGYLNSREALNRTLLTFAKHLAPGGIVIVEPWLTHEVIQEKSIHARFFETDNLKIARFNTTVVKNNRTIMTFHYMVGRPEGIEYFTEVHNMGLFSHEEYTHAFCAANLGLVYDKYGLTGRGLYIGTKAIS